MDPWTEFLSGLRITELGASGLLVITVLLILMGRLVPGRERDAWRDAYFKEKEAGMVKNQQITDLTRAVEVSVRALDALPPSGGDSDAEEVVGTTSPPRRARRQG